MAIEGIGNRTIGLAERLVEMRQQFELLQRQLSSKRKSDTYAGMGSTRGFGLSLRSQLSDVEGYKDTQNNVNIRLNVVNTALGRMVSLNNEIQTGATTGPLQIDQTGQTVLQKTTRSALGEMIQLLNSQAGDRYVFSGRTVDTPPVASLNDILNGNGPQAGVTQLITERRQADLGASGMGRVTVTQPTATSVQVAEDVAGSPFGFKLSAITSTLTGSAVTGPAGAPAAMSVNLTAVPADGQTIKFSFTLPDGSKESVELTASTNPAGSTNAFQIGATPAATAANLSTALSAAVGKLANTALYAASAMKASSEFFSATPQRVAGPPFNTATALVAATPANTVSWYTGENGPDPARGTGIARIDQAMTVEYGARANEQAITWKMQTFAAFAAMTTSPSDPNALGQVGALKQRVAQNLTPQAGQQQVQDIMAEMAGAQSAMKAAGDRQTQSKTMLNTMLGSIEGVTDEEVAAKIMALQTSMQATYQTTAMIYQLSLVKYL